MTKDTIPDKYCTHCGARMKVIKEFIGRYNSKNGNKLYNIFYKCPLRYSGFFSGFSSLFDRHNQYYWEYTVCIGDNIYNEKVIVE